MKDIVFEDVFPSEEELSSPAKSICPVCQTSFKNWQSLNAHRLRNHAASKSDGDSSYQRYFCPREKCKYSKIAKKVWFKSMKLLKQHFQKVHMAKLLVCSVCKERRFSLLRDLQFHEKLIFGGRDLEFYFSLSATNMATVYVLLPACKPAKVDAETQTNFTVDNKDVQCEVVEKYNSWPSEGAAGTSHSEQRNPFELDSLDFGCQAVACSHESHQDSLLMNNFCQTTSFVADASVDANLPLLSAEDHHHQPPPDPLLTKWFFEDEAEEISGTLMQVFCLTITTAVEVEEMPADHPQVYTMKPPVNKHPRDYTDADLQGLFDQWEANDDPLDPDEIEGWRKPPPLDLNLLKVHTSEQASRIIKKDREMKLFVKFDPKMSRAEIDDLTNIWLMRFFNNHIISKRRFSQEKEVEFLFIEGSQAWDAYHFVMDQDEVYEVMLEGNKYKGKAQLPVPTTSIILGGYTSLLDEQSVALQVYALENLDNLVPSFWHEIADCVSRIEELYEDEHFPRRKLAALLASKVYYYLGIYKEALKYALCAEELFDVKIHSEYSETIVAIAIDEYIKLRNAEKKSERVGQDWRKNNYDKEKVEERRARIMKQKIKANRNKNKLNIKKEEPEKPKNDEEEDRKNIDAALEKDCESEAITDPRLEAVINRMFDRCFAECEFKQIVGIALETRRIDMLNKALIESKDTVELAAYCAKCAVQFVQNRTYRNEVFFHLVELCSSSPLLDYNTLCQCLLYLENPEQAMNCLKKMLEGSKESVLAAYQIAFDLFDSASQHYLTGMLKCISPPEVEEKKDETNVENSDSKNKPKEEKEKSEEELPLEPLRRILSGELTIFAHMQFLIKNNRADLQILKNIKDTVRSSVCHTATVIANGIMYCGTTCDDFLRNNVDWVSKANNWSKFSAVASLGVIHKGHESEATRLLESYLPKDVVSATSSGYLEAGGFYALGLIHAGHGNEALFARLQRELNSTNNEVLRHGLCLGFGVAAFGSMRGDLCDDLRTILFQDEAVAAEAAGIGIGLILAGSLDYEVFKEMYMCANDTQHEKIQRGICIGIACIAFGRMEQANSWADELLKDQNPILRRAGVYTLAMAYCGSGNTNVVGRLLHLSVSDVNDDVRRAAVSSIGFVMARNPTACPQLVSLLMESYNPNLRYGAAIALGVSCIASGLREAIALLEPMLDDTVNYVRQGALIAMAMVLMQHNECTAPKVKDFREKLMKIIGDKHEDVISKFGAIIAQGLLDAGGRNVTVSLIGRNENVSMITAIGLLVFLQSWYWFPLAHFISLALQPSCLIGLNSELKMPNMTFISNAKPSTYAYPPQIVEKQAKNPEKVVAAVLSFTHKSKRREREKQAKQQEQEEKMDVDEAAVNKNKDKDAPDAAETATQAAPSAVPATPVESSAAAVEKVPSVESNVAVAEPKAAATPADTTTTTTTDSTTTTATAAAATTATATVATSTSDVAVGTSDLEAENKPAVAAVVEPESTFDTLNNPARVTKLQLKVMTMPENSNFIPIKPITHGGIIMMNEKSAEVAVDFVEEVKANVVRGDEEAEPTAPSPFDYFIENESNGQNQDQTQTDSTPAPQQ
ncbi:26S proteasome non-ATPase regulatory subunit 1 [Trichinella zimbabwensis]|uniref:26S proteasome non-ATPase regulatory subunit 1 n=1 Tax=Trichinella zimbabwensis TaxID=268475 RepID=A0A0V1HNG5_9BILA|nr:26S proteasome non-ATPase regulatory subunit 1 [Trichinella zimbabwensis]